VDVIGVVAGVVVGVAFVAAGVLKLVEGRAWLKQAVDMEVSRPVARVVPYVEIVVGALLAAQVFTPWPAIAALVMLVIFTVVIARRLLDGTRPPCACFGSRSKRPLGAYHVVRNLALMAAAVLAVLWA
jgi:uncharacterized membrane protein YphA (DoxX/SURF4 family)